MGIDKEPKAGPDAPYDLRTPYHDYLLRKMLPADKMEARRLARHTKSFTVINGELYKQSHMKILQCCIPIE